MAIADYVLDKSALTRARDPGVDVVLRPLVSAGRTSICGMAALEVLYSARSGPDHERMVRGLNAHEWLITADADFRRAIDVQGELARTGRHRAARLPDLLVAAIAERHRVTVMHYDGDFDLIAEITGQRCRWVVPRGSVD